MRHRIKEAVDLDVIVEADAGQAPLGLDIFAGRQLTKHWTLDGLKQLAPADAEATHRALVDPAQRLAARRIAFGQREKGEVAQPARLLPICRIRDAEPSSKFHPAKGGHPVK